MGLHSPRRRAVARWAVAMVEGTHIRSPFDEDSARGKRAEGAPSMESAAKARALARLPVRPEQAAIALCWREQPQCGCRDATLAYSTEALTGRIHQEGCRAPGHVSTPPDWSRGSRTGEDASGLVTAKVAPPAQAAGIPNGHTLQGWPL